MGAQSEVVERLRATFESGVTRSLEWREKQLRALLRMCKEQEERFIEAGSMDIRRPQVETLISEIGVPVSRINFALKNLRAWTKPQPVKGVDLVQKPCSAATVAEPLGVVCILTPWNLPLNLSIDYLVGALSAGNCVLLKPSEYSPACSALLAELIPTYLDKEAVAVVEGDAQVAADLLTEKYDFIHFTGGTYAGKKVYQAAAANMTPCALELGGKNPVYVHEDAQVEVAARRVLWTKFGNAGQICLAADYVLVHEKVADQFFQQLDEAYRRFFPNGEPSTSDISSIISERHFERLQDLMNEDESLRGEAVIGGYSDKKSLTMGPVVLKNPKLEAKVMGEEIFGPILPVISVKDSNEAIKIMKKQAKPLAVYLFTGNSATIREVKSQTSSGALSINELMMHAAISALPFGGVGASGFGRGNGKADFDGFSNQKSILTKPAWKMLDIDLRYPPYSENKYKWWHFLLVGK